MKIQIQNIKFKNNIKYLSDIYTKKGIVLSSQYEGLDCIVMNGYIANIKGEPFANEMLQSKFKEFAKKAEETKMIFIGRLVDHGYLGETNKYQRLRLLDKKKSFLLNMSGMDDIKLEVEDIRSIVGAKLSATQRFNVAQSIILSSNKYISGGEVRMQNFIKPGMVQRETLDKFIETALENNMTLVVREEGIADYYYTAPYKTENAKILKYSRTTKEKIAGNQVESLRTIFARSLDLEKPVKITMFTEECELSQVLLKDLDSKRLESIKYKYYIFNNKICVRKF